MRKKPKETDIIARLERWVNDPGWEPLKKWAEENRKRRELYARRSSTPCN